MAELAKTPLHSLHSDRGGRLVDFAGWSMPVQYQSIMEEHRATRQAVGLFDVSHMGRLRFDGEHAQSWLDHLLTRSVAKLKPGGVRYSLLTNDAGQVLDDVLAYHVPASGDDDAHFLLVVNASNRLEAIQHLESHAHQPPCPWRDLTVETAMIAVQGPLAIQCANPLLSIDLSQLRYYHCAPATILGHPCFVSRTGYTGEDGCELIVDSQAAREVWEAMEQQPQHARPVGLGARDTLRLEAGMPLYGHELSREINPFQAGLDFAVNLGGRDFPGSEQLAQIHAQPPETVRVGLQLLGKRIAREHAKVLAGDATVGEVTSGTFSPTLERPIAMAMIERSHSTPGTQLTVEIRGKSEPAEVAALPFYKRPS